MFDYRIAFGSPGYLLLLALLPVLWWYSLPRLNLLGRHRRWIALGVRSAVLLMLVCALAEIQVVRVHDRLTVMYLLDQSASISPPQRKTMVERVQAAIDQQRRGEDRAGVIAFARDAAIEVPPNQGSARLSAIESPLDRDYTNLTAAMKQAQAALLEDSNHRVVLISDGNENVGDARRQAQSLVDQGVGIDVWPIRYEAAGEVVVEKLSVPADVRRGQPFELKAVLSTSLAPSARADTVRGRLIFSRQLGNRTEVLNPDASQQRVELSPGKQVFPIRQTIDAAGFYSYQVRFEPDEGREDQFRQNNRATSFVHIRGKGRVLLIDNVDHPGTGDRLAERFRRQGLDLHVMASNRLFSTPGELLPYDSVVLLDVPREHFTDEQIAMLARNTQQMGSGLVMLGGPNSFAPGGWTHTELEKAMPVDFRIDNAKVVPGGALVLVIDRSGSMEGRKNQMSKAAAMASVQTLSAKDYLGVVSFDTMPHWVVPLDQLGAAGRVRGRIASIGAGGGTNLYPAMEAAYEALAKVEASVKHMVVLTDGRTAGSEYPELAARMAREQISVSTVAVGTDAAVPLLSEIAVTGRGRFYLATDPDALPRIFLSEARRIARPLIWQKHPVHPAVCFPHEMVRGLDDTLPPIRGFVLTQTKSSPLVEVALRSPEPSERKNNALLASWTYGSGRAVAFTSDIGPRWTSEWVERPLFDKLFGQIVRWSMRPADNADRFSISAEVEQQRVRLVVNALGPREEFLNFLPMAGSAVGPDLKARPFDLVQVAPGRYVGSFPIDAPGSHFVAIDPGGTTQADGTTSRAAPIVVGVNVLYSPEFRDRRSNDPLLRALAELTPRGGKPGRLIDGPGDDFSNPLLTADPFRRGELAPTFSRRDAWPLVLLLGSWLLFFDVLVRRVHIDVRATLASLGWASLAREPVTAPSTAAPRVGRKVKSARFAPSARRAAGPAPLEQEPRPVAPTEKPAQPTKKRVKTKEKQPEPQSYTDRLLKAKRDVWKKGSDP